MYAELNTKSDYCQICGYDGEIEIVFYNDDSLLKTVNMTFCQSELTWNII